MLIYLDDHADPKSKLDHAPHAPSTGGTGESTSARHVAEALRYGTAKWQQRHLA